MLKEEETRMRLLLIEAISTLCRSGIQYKTGMKVEGLIGITVDDNEIMLVNVNKQYQYGSIDEETDKNGLAQSNKEEKSDDKKTEQHIEDVQYDNFSAKSEEQFTPHRKRRRRNSTDIDYSTNQSVSFVNNREESFNSLSEQSGTKQEYSPSFVETSVTDPISSQVSNTTSNVDEGLITNVKIELSSDSENEASYYEQYQGDNSSFSFTPDMELAPVPVSVYSAVGQPVTASTMSGSASNYALGASGSSQDMAMFGTPKKIGGKIVRPVVSVEQNSTTSTRSYAAQKQKRYRERMKNNPTYMQKERERSKKYYQNLTHEQKCTFQQKNTLRVRKRRDRKRRKNSRPPTPT